VNSVDDLEETALQIKRYRVALAYSQRGYAKLSFRRPDLPDWLKQEIRNRRRGLARLMQAGDIRLCPSPDLHRSSWFYAGRGRYTCALCQRIDAHQL